MLSSSIDVQSTLPRFVVDADINSRLCPAGSKCTLEKWVNSWVLVDETYIQMIV